VGNQDVVGLDAHYLWWRLLEHITRRGVGQRTEMELWICSKEERGNRRVQQAKRWSWEYPQPLRRYSPTCQPQRRSVLLTPSTDILYLIDDQIVVTTKNTAKIAGIMMIFFIRHLHLEQSQ